MQSTLDNLLFCEQEHGCGIHGKGSSHRFADEMGKDLVGKRLLVNVLVCYFGS